MTGRCSVALNEMNDSASQSPKEQLEAYFQNPPLMMDPVYPANAYLRVFATGMLGASLHRANHREAVRSIRAMHEETACIAVGVGALVLWAFDIRSDEDKRSFTERVLSRSKDSKPADDGQTINERLLNLGVSKIQVEDPQNPAVPGQYQLCQLKIIGWYVAGLVPPRGFSPAARSH
jgi:hypothetical protein